MNNIATVNGLLDGISVLEHDNEHKQSALHSDLLYNENEPVDLDLQGIYYDEGYTVSNYQVEDFGEAVTLLSTITTEEAIFGSKDSLQRSGS